jgi:high-affinity iron transporter
MLVTTRILYKSFTRIDFKSNILLNVLTLLIPVLFLSTFFNSTSHATEEIRRILSLVDYIGGDYKNAVRRGEVINQEEYKEMLEFSAEALELFMEQKALDGDRAGIESDLIKLKKGIEDKSSDKEVELISKGIKDRVISAYNIIPYPQNHPSFRAGVDLYERNCAQCHGVLGAGDGPLASSLNPPPTNFTDGNATGGLSPFKVYNTMSFGIEGTAMPSFKNFSEDDKWDVAFYVLSLRFSQKESIEGGKIFKTTDIPGSIKEPKTLATLSNDELSDKLDPYIRNNEDLQNVVAFLRRGTVETEKTEEDPLILTNTLLKEALRLYEKGDGKGAYTKALDAYLDGFEKVEPALISRDQAFVSMLEAKFVTFRGLIKDESPIEDVKSLYREIEKDLKHASSILRNNQPIGKALSFVNSFAIMLREGLEAALIVAAMLAFLGATGAQNAIKYVHLGWVLALVAGGVTWFLAQTVISISGAQREIIEGVTSLLAAAVLFYVSYWLITKVEVRKWKEYIQGRVKKALSKKSLFALASVSFFAVYREAFETVLFYQALLLQTDNSRGTVIWGLVVGAVLLLGLVIVIFKLGLRIPLKYFFSITSFLLYFLSFVFAGKGMREFQEAGIVGITPLNYIPQVDILGIYPTLETSIVQGVLLLALIVSLLWLGVIKQEKEKKEIVVSVSRIADDMKVMHDSFEHIKGHIVEWKRCKEIDLEAEELDNQIQDVIKRVDELENKLEDVFDMILKNNVTTKEPQTN